MGGAGLSETSKTSTYVEEAVLMEVAELRQGDISHGQVSQLHAVIGTLLGHLSLALQVYKGDEVEEAKDETGELDALKEKNQCLREALLQEKNAHANQESELQEVPECVLQVEGIKPKVVLNRLDEIPLTEKKKSILGSAI